MHKRIFAIDPRRSIAASRGLLADLPEGVTLRRAKGGTDMEFVLEGTGRLSANEIDRLVRSYGKVT